MASSTPRTTPDPEQHHTTEALAAALRTSPEEVERLYQEEFTNLAADAKITQYLDVLATRRVKMKLRGGAEQDDLERDS
jgi:hypothetical protein